MKEIWEVMFNSYIVISIIGLILLLGSLIISFKHFIQKKKEETPGSLFYRQKKRFVTCLVITHLIIPCIGNA
jgi:heme/copper-type cytochrome/quinol oxidase subunit 2